MNYTESIRTRQPQKALDHFTKELQYFIAEEDEIIKELKQCTKDDWAQKEYLILDYYKKWIDFVERPPFPECPTYISEEHPEEDLSLTTLYGKGYTRQCKYNEKFVDALIQYIAYLYSKNGLFHGELIIWFTLKNIEKVFNLLIVLINPRKIVKMVKKYIEDFNPDAPIKPETTYYMTECHEHKLSSSAKGAIATHKQLEDAIGHFILDFYKQANRYPTRTEIKRFTTGYCRASSNPHLHKWSTGIINNKTLAKITHRYRSLITRKRKGLMQYINTDICHKSPNLKEVWDNMTEIEKQNLISNK